MFEANGNVLARLEMMRKAKTISDTECERAVKVQLSRADRRLMPGMSARVTMELGQ